MSTGVVQPAWLMKLVAFPDLSTICVAAGSLTTWIFVSFYHQVTEFKTTGFGEHNNSLFSELKVDL